MKVEDQIVDKGLAMCDKCDYFISVEEAYNQGKADAENGYNVGFADGYLDGFNDGYKACLDRVKEHLYYLDISNIPNDLWNIGVDNMCDHIDKEMQKGNE